VVTGLQFHDLSVARVIVETADASSFVLTVPESLRAAFAYRAGQHLTFRVTVAGEELLRCYSLSSAPETEPEIKVTVKRVAQGRVSNWFNDRVVVGTVLSVAPPMGRFVLRDHAGSLFLVAGGSGITPIISLAKSALATTLGRIRLVYANRDRASIIFADELAAVAQRAQGRLDIVHHLDSETGFLDGACLLALAAGWRQADFYICGPEPLMVLAEETAQVAGVNADHVFVERFLALAPQVSEPTVAADEICPESIIVIFNGEERTIPYRRGQSVLQAAEAAGLNPPTVCGQGICGTCMGTVREGKARMHQNEVLTPSEVASGLILTCQAVPVSERLKVEY